MNPPLVNLSPLGGLLLLAASLALLPLLWIGLRRRGVALPGRLAALTGVALFLTFDLIVVGAYTRLSDSGLGCPDWPGCYGQAHPWAAGAEIVTAQAVLPDGPVTVAKAWTEMLHRYLAMVVGALILVLALLSWAARRHLPHSWLWPAASLVWVLVQGAFGRYTVTLKLYPAIVTLHLLGALVLLGLLVVQHESYGRADGRAVLDLSPGLRRWLLPALALLLLQIGLGGWVSSNYAVLACQGFPQCNGAWWPASAADAEAGFTLLRELGRGASGDYLPASALVAIQLAHRAMAGGLSLALLGLVGALLNQGGRARSYGLALLGLLALQLASGIGNVVLQWPLAGALLHSGGSAALLALLLILHRRSAPVLPAESRPAVPRPAATSADTLRPEGLR